MRVQLIDQIAAEILARPFDGVFKVAIDGVVGAGKTCFAEELFTALREKTDRHIIRASAENFLNPRRLRYRKSRLSAEGFFNDAYNYEELKNCLLDPLQPSGSRQYKTAARPSSLRLPDTADALAPEDALLLFDGIFLHREELFRYWNYSVFLEVDFEIAHARTAWRNEKARDLSDAVGRRIVDGQKIYFDRCTPTSRATVIVNNNVLEHPFFV